MPKFLLQYEGAVLKEIPITKADITVGRKPDNDIVIDNPTVSGHHCKITMVGDTFFVEDLNSSNGVFLNAKKIMKSGLKNNDVIGVAKHALKFVDERFPQESTIPPPPSAPSAPPSPPRPVREMPSSPSAPPSCRGPFSGVGVGDA